MTSVLPIWLLSTVNPVIVIVFPAPVADADTAYGPLLNQLNVLDDPGEIGHASCMVAGSMVPAKLFVNG